MGREERRRGSSGYHGSTHCDKHAADEERRGRGEGGGERERAHEREVNGEVAPSKDHRSEKGAGGVGRDEVFILKTVRKLLQINSSCGRKVSLR
jgi:hypothetical protein